MFKLKNVFPYLHNRFIVPSHKVIIRDKEFGHGRYHDPDYILLYSSFQILVDYVEIESAVFGPDVLDTPLEKFYDILDTIPGLRWFLPPAQNAMKGLLKLKWEMSLKDHPSQVESAKAIYKLYKFWVHDRPQRTDPWDMVSDDETEKVWSHKPLTLSPSYQEQLLRASILEDKYHEEDDEMLQLLMKYRRCLWV